MTFNDAAQRALRLIGVIDPDEGASPKDLVIAMSAANSMLKAWAAKKIMVYQTTQASVALPASTVSITIGTAGDINTGTPHAIQSAYVRLNGIDYYLDEISLPEYSAWSDKDTTGLPEFFALRKGFPLWTMYFKPLPDVAYTLYVETRQPFTGFTAVTDEISFPGEYEEGIVFNLAMRLAPEYRVQASQELGMFAADSLKTIKNKNSHPVSKIDVTPFGSKRSYNINSDE